MNESGEDLLSTESGATDEYLVLQKLKEYLLKLKDNR